jgi:hypothetical protein
MIDMLWEACQLRVQEFFAALEAVHGWLEGSRMQRCCSAEMHDQTTNHYSATLDANGY